MVELTEHVVESTLHYHTKEKEKYIRWMKENRRKKKNSFEFFCPFFVLLGRLVYSRFLSLPLLLGLWLGSFRFIKEPSGRPISFSTIHTLFLLPLARVRIRVRIRVRVRVAVELG
jgi:hypothetical protein